MMDGLTVKRLYEIADAAEWYFECDKLYDSFSMTRGLMGLDSLCEIRGQARRDLRTLVEAKEALHGDQPTVEDTEDADNARARDSY